MRARKTFACFLTCSLLSILLSACNQAKKSSAERKTATDTIVRATHKPSSSFHDTLEIATAAAVFFEPDSLQMQRIKAVTNEQVFKGSMHEYVYQTRNAHLFLQAHWKRLKIIDTKNVRYLLFKKMDNTFQLLDLDKYDPYGMFVFDKNQAPLLIDMMNVETQVPDYFAADKEAFSGNANKVKNHSK